MVKNKNKLGLSWVLAQIQNNIMPATIAEKNNIPKQSLDYHLQKLKKLGCVRKEAYGVWKYIKDVPELPKGTLDLNNRTSKHIRGHAFIWKIAFFTPINWEEVIKSYKGKKLSFSRICRDTMYRTMFESRKIWFTKDGLTIYEPLDFLGASGMQVKGQAVFEMDLLIKSLLKSLNLAPRPYRFTCSREHYAIMKNELARQYNDRKEKMIIKSEDGTAWLWIDHSHGVHELETKDPIINHKVDKFWNGHKKHDFKVDADFVLEGFARNSEAIQKNTENLDYHAENMKSHVKAVQELGESVRALTELIKEMKR